MQLLTMATITGNCVCANEHELIIISSCSFLLTDGLSERWTGAHTTKMSIPSSGVVTVEILEYGPSPTVKADTAHS